MEKLTGYFNTTNIEELKAEWKRDGTLIIHKTADEGALKARILIIGKKRTKWYEPYIKRIIRFLERFL